MKRERRLIWQIYFSFLFIILFSLLATGIYTSKTLRHFFLQRTQTSLVTQGRLLTKQIALNVDTPDALDLNRRCRETAKDTPTRLTFILPNGKVLCDSHQDPATMDNHRSRPEIAKALNGNVGTAVRFSATLRQKMMYVALPLIFNGKVAAVLRTSLPITAIDTALKGIQVRIALFGVLLAVIASLICLYVSRWISRPIEALKIGAERYAEGDLHHRLGFSETIEFAGLAEAMNRMAAELENRIETVERQRNELEAVLSSMMEGVIAVDLDENVIRLNQKAEKMFANDSRQLVGRGVQELIRNSDLYQMIRDTLSRGKNTEGDITFQREGERILNIRCTKLQDAEGNRIGALLVMNDVTLLRRLENMRRDFAANVSHEIKTPLTAIKGFVETINHGDVGEPEEIRRFLGIIENHVNRLSAILEDLMQLSRLEREDELRQLMVHQSRLKETLQTAINLCRESAENKRITVDLNCDASLAAGMDRALMEQAFVNLIDNAIKYSPEGSRIDIATESADGDIRIAFKDQGMGIAKKHLPRLFERFYRVDKARSRKLGGTGLGLAIVKHIVQAHDGRITVDSVLGEGSVFTIHLPKR